MSLKDEIIKSYKQKAKEIKRHNKYYFIDDHPKITDAKFDELKKEFLKLESEHDFLKELNLSKNLVGFSPTNKFKKIRHIKPMLSLANAFNSEDMESFIKKVNNYLNMNNSNLDLFAEPKIDGISATLIYENGILTKGLSRGDGLVGEDILENLKTISSIPKNIQKKIHQNYWKSDVKFLSEKRTFLI